MQENRGDYSILTNSYNCKFNLRVQTSTSPPYQTLNVPPTYYGRCPVSLANVPWGKKN